MNALEEDKLLNQRKDIEDRIEEIKLLAPVKSDDVDNQNDEEGEEEQIEKYECEEDEEGEEQIEQNIINNEDINFIKRKIILNQESQKKRIENNVKNINAYRQDVNRSFNFDNECLKREMRSICKDNFLDKDADQNNKKKNLNKLRNSYVYNKEINYYPEFDRDKKLKLVKKEAVSSLNSAVKDNNKAPG